VINRRHGLPTNQAACGFWQLLPTTAMKYLLAAALLSITVAKANIRLQFIHPELPNTIQGRIPAQEIKVYDLRGFQDKIGFIPDIAQPTCLYISGSLPGWLQSNLYQASLAQGTKRHITVAIQEFWCETLVARSHSNSTLKPQLRLAYQFDVFSHTPSGIFAVKRLKGEISRKFTDIGAYAQLCTEITELLVTSLQTVHFSSRENEKTRIQEDAFTSYLNTVKKSIPNAKPQTGVFYTREDLQKGSICAATPEHSVVHKNLEGKPIITKLLINKTGNSDYPFAYADGNYLFLHTNNGFYVRLEPISNGYLFTDLYELAMLRRKHYNQISIDIGQSKLDAIRNFAKVYRLYYLLDMRTGKLI
jgi:hypothetical protein